MRGRPTDPDYTATLHACETCGTVYVGHRGRYRCESMRWHDVGGMRRCEGRIEPMVGIQGPESGVRQRLAVIASQAEYDAARYVIDPQPPTVIGEPQNLPYKTQESPITQPNLQS